MSYVAFKESLDKRTILKTTQIYGPRMKTFEIRGLKVYFSQD